MLKVLPLDKAQALLLGEVARLARDRSVAGSAAVDSEKVTLAEASGRILASPLFAPLDVPAFDRSQVDGLAVRAADTFGASESLPAILTWVGEIAMGQAAWRPLGAGECMGIATGGMLPPGADAVVMIEDVEQIDGDTRLATRSVSPGSHVTLRGDDARQGQMILSAGRRLHAPEIGAIAALGLDRIDVLRRVSVAVLSTGDELMVPGTSPGAAQGFGDGSPDEAVTGNGDANQPTGIAIPPPGDANQPTASVFDCNGPMLTAAIQEVACLPVSFGIVPDRLDALTQTLQQALQQTDLVLISGGSSAGVRDYVERAITAAGEPGVILHGLAVKPGKPTLAGVCQDKLVIGLPGHPVAAWFVFEQLVKPVLAALQNRSTIERPRVKAQTTCRIPSNHGREEFILVRLTRGSVENPTEPTLTSQPAPAATWLAEPLPTRSGLVTLLSASDGYLVIERDSEGLEKGSLVDVSLLHADPEAASLADVSLLHADAEAANLADGSAAQTGTVPANLTKRT